MVGIIKVWNQAKTGKFSHQHLEELLNDRGLMRRIFRGKFKKGFDHSSQICPVGVLFGLGFDTATEISLFGIAATEAANGSSSLLSVMVFPALFTAGMALVDTLDGVLMVGAYQWAYLNPRRKITYNLIITGLSVVVALVIGLIEVLGLLQEKLDLSGKFWDQVSLLWDHFGDLGFIIVCVS